MNIVVYNSSMIMYVNWITVPVAALEMFDGSEVCELHAHDT